MNNVQIEPVYLFNNSGNQKIPIKEFFTLGRSSTVNFSLSGEGISDRHARIEKKGQGFIIRDLQSQTGTFVNGAKIIEAHIQNQDRIRIGETEFVFCIGEQKPLKTIQSKSPRWKDQLLKLPTVADSEASIMILGESGVGKDVLAKWIHENSPRREAPFLAVNCSALSESLIESELFGHVKGSFTGALNDRKGAFEATRGGTLFLDEIADLPQTLQPKLLRALENREIRPVGSDKSITTDVRIIAATHQNLLQKVKNGTFRLDLYYRLNIVKLTIPSLRSRMEDFDDLLFQFCKEYHISFTFEAIELFKEHYWPGNIRELKNTIIRASALFPRSKIDQKQIPSILEKESILNTATSYYSEQTENSPLIKKIEKNMIIERLLANKGNQRKTAIDLKLPKSTLHDRIKSYNINIHEVLQNNLQNN